MAKRTIGNRLYLDGKPTEWNWDVYHRHICCGETIRSIAADVGVSPNRIGQVIKDVDDYLANDTWHVQRIKVSKGRHLARLEHVYNEAWKAFRRSVTVNTRKVVLGKERGADSDYTEETDQRLAGDPRFLREMREALADQRKILGTDAPRKSAVTNATGDGPAELRLMLENATDDELEKIAESQDVLERLLATQPN